VLDEPTAPSIRRAQVIRDLIASERDRGCALLVTTHELTEAERTSNRVVIMNADTSSSTARSTSSRLARDDRRTLRPVDPALLARNSSASSPPTVQSTPLRDRIDAERMAVLNDYLTSVGVTLLSLRTRASLEERYLELIEQERREVRP